MARKKSKGTELSVFKGREAKLNRALFKVLADNGPATTYVIHKQIKRFRILKNTHYANVNKRVRALNQTGYLREIDVIRTKAGFASTVYELTNRTYLAIELDRVGLDNLIKEIDDDSAGKIHAILKMLSNYKK